MPHIRNRFIAGAITLVLLGLSQGGRAQFAEEFSQPTAGFQEQGVTGWNSVFGDGEVLFTQKVEAGHASLRVDARLDPRNIWYAFMQTDVVPALSREALRQPHHALHIEARVRPSHAPRRVNLYLASPQTEGQPSFLREFDLPTANEWYTISMTSQAFELGEQAPLIGQVSLMDWGNSDVYQLDVDYLRVSIVDTTQAPKDQARAVRYRPPLAGASSFRSELKVSDDTMIDRAFPDENFNAWVLNDSLLPVLTVDATKIVVLRWDFSQMKGQNIQGEGQLELYTQAVQRRQDNPKDFGEIRICEIIGGPKNWQEEKVTYQTLLNDQPIDKVINAQTVVDVPLTPGYGSKTTVTISQYVLQRLLDGQTSGLAILPLGLINGTLVSREQENDRYAARLRFNLSSP